MAGYDANALPPGAGEVLEATRRWVEKAVIGLNLCPFAKSVYVREQARFEYSDATTPEQLLEHLGEELLRLQQILFYRELEFPLEAITAVLSRGALMDH